MTQSRALERNQKLCTYLEKFSMQVVNSEVESKVNEVDSAFVE